MTANSAKDNQGILHKQKKHFEGDILRADYESKIKAKSAITENRIWPDKTKIPYEIYPDIYGIKHPSVIKVYSLFADLQYFYL